MKIARLYTEAVESVRLADWEKRVCAEFGGFTKYKGQGGYLTSDKILQFETSYTFELVVENQVSEPRILEFARELGVICGQESVLVVFIGAYDAKLVYTKGGRDG